MNHIANEITDRLLDKAGITEGMEVLELGCARGDLTSELARRVGKEGRVLGVDRDPKALMVAARKARELGLSQVTFVARDLSEPLTGIGSFDAIVGRRVLMYLPDPVGVLRGLVSSLRPGGRMAFQEHDGSMAPASSIPMPLHEQLTGWFWETVRREGGDLKMGLGLFRTLEEAGLRVDGVRAEAILQIPEAPHPFVPIAQAMLPRIVAEGVATEEEVDIDTLEARLNEEREANRGTYLSDMAFYAWATKPRVYRKNSPLTDLNSSIVEPDE